MEEISLSETETRYFSDLFLCCDVEKTNKIPILKAKELFRSANLQDDVVDEILSIAGIPSAALHVSRVQFFSCLKLIAAHQASVTLRHEVIAATMQLPLPRFSWKDSPAGSADTSANAMGHQANGLNSIPPPPATDRRNSLTRRTDWNVEHSSGATSNSRRSSSSRAPPEQDVILNSDVQSTDSEVEQNESSCGGGHEGGTNSRDAARRRGSPEAWSTNSDSPTPTNSVAERPWAKENLWHGLLGDEHRQLLGTEEESSDRHSSDEDNDTVLDTIYQITSEQREYYYKQFKTVQHDANGLLSGHVARVFFEKSRIPVEELRHIWQLCDVTRDGALSLAEFTAAMHLVVLRRNNIPLPAVLPPCLYPSALKQEPLAGASAPSAVATAPQEPPEADLLHLNDDDDDDYDGENDNEDNTILSATGATATTADAAPHSRSANDTNIMNISTLSTSSQASNNSRQGIVATNQCSLTPQYSTAKEQSIASSPIAEPLSNVEPNATLTDGTAKDRSLWGGATDVPPTQWTKFSESPTANVSSPGPKPLNFDMQRTAQAVVSDPQILHPVPLRVTPVAGAANASSTTATMQTNSEEACDVVATMRDNSPKAMAAAGTGQATIPSASSGMHRDSLQSIDLRAIQRPQPKKLQIAKNIGALPPPPQREPSVGGNGASCDGDVPIFATNQSHQVAVQHQAPPPQQTGQPVSKKDPPPLPPPRPPHRHTHGRSSSLDLNKFRMTTPNSSAAPPEMTAQTSFDCQTSAGFADFTQFSDGTNQQHSLPPRPTECGGTQIASTSSSSSQNVAVAPTRLSLQTNQQRVSAFEVYRKPKTPRNSQSPQPIAAQPPLPNADLYEKRVIAISDTLKHVSFKPNSNNAMPEVLRHLREQNQLLLRLCNDLSDELLSVQTRKEELRLKLETVAAAPPNTHLAQVTRTGSSISAPVTANVTGGSGSSGVQSNI